MSMLRSTLPRPGPARITLVLLAVIPAVMGCPWSSTRDRWVLGAAVAVSLALLGWWRGLHVTTFLRRRAAMLRHHSGVHTDRRPGSDARVTALLRVTPSGTGPGVLPLSLIAGYLDRYGLRADAIRVTSRDKRSGADATQRDTWIGLTFSATENLAALRARSPLIPLQATAEVAARRLGADLRELGWEVAGAGPDDVPKLFSAGARESWRALTDADGDFVAAYRIGVDRALSDTLAHIRADGALQTWIAVEIAGHEDHRSIAAGCALRTGERPSGAGPLPGLAPQHGRHRAVLCALHPLSGIRLDGHTGVAADDIAALRWPVQAEVAEVAGTAGVATRT